MENKAPRPRAKEKSCDHAIRKTLAYSAVFKYPMSFYQLSNFLVTRKEFETNFFYRSLRRLVKKKHIKAVDAKYYLPSIRPVSWKLRAKYSKEIMNETEIAVKILRVVPWIKFLAVTGSVASYNAVKDDDVDIFIITEKNRLWLTRGFVSVLLSIINKYAHGGEGNKKLCCNLFLDDSKMKWDKDKQTLYTAREILSMQPLINKNDTYFRFIYENIWALSYFKNFRINFPLEYKKEQRSKSKIIDKFEQIAYKMQTKRMKSKQTIEIITKNLAHFRTHDHSDEILKEYQTIKETL